MGQRNTRVIDRAALAEKIGSSLDQGLPPRPDDALDESPAKAPPGEKGSGAADLDSVTPETPETPETQETPETPETDELGDPKAVMAERIKRSLRRETAASPGSGAIPTVQRHSPKRGETSVFTPAPEGTLLYWIFCDPLEPIPLGFSREITAGRHHKNDLVLPHNEVSRFHAAFKVRGRSVTLEDLGSSNGIYINGVRRLQHMIDVGDQIKIGPYEITIRAKDDYQRGAEDDLEDTNNKTRSSPAYGAFSEENIALSGNLQDTPLPELLQGFEFNGKTGTLVVIHRNIFGWIGVKVGAPHSAGFQNKHGAEACLDMLKFKDGHFTFYNIEPEGDRSIQGTITGILLDASRREDEEQGGELGALDALDD